MIIVTGATGQLGRAILEALLVRMPSSAIVAAARDPSKLGDLAHRGICVRRGDYDDSDSLTSAFEGATQVLLISSNAEAEGRDPVAHHRTAISVAKAAGVRRLVYTSHMGANAQSKFLPMHTHAATEAILSEASMPWTALRNGFYAESAVRMMGDVAGTGVVASPADGKVAWTTHADLAAAAVSVLVDEGRFEGPTPPLTAQQALDFAELAAIASDVLDHRIERRLVPQDAFRATLTGQGIPTAVVEILTGFYLAAQDGEFSALDPTLSALIGRKPLGMREVLASHLHGK